MPETMRPMRKFQGRQTDMNVQQIVSLVGTATLQTLSMVFFSTIFSLILGLPLGILLCVTDPVSGIMPKPILNQILTRIVNVPVYHIDDTSFPARSHYRWNEYRNDRDDCSAFYSRRSVRCPRYRIRA